jgi:hypothetical protein
MTARLSTPWIRVHARVGGEILRPASAAIRVTATVAEWERWTGMALPESGMYVVPGALVPVEIDCGRDIGEYREPLLDAPPRPGVVKRDARSAATGRAWGGCFTLTTIVGAAPAVTPCFDTGGTLRRPKGQMREPSVTCPQAAPFAEVEWSEALVARAALAMCGSANVVRGFVSTVETGEQVRAMAADGLSQREIAAQRETRNCGGGRQPRPPMSDLPTDIRRHIDARLEELCPAVSE